MRRVTLRELTEMLQGLPSEVLDKEIGYLDLAHMDAEAFKNLERQLRETVNKDGWIEICEN